MGHYEDYLPFPISALTNVVVANNVVEGTGHYSQNGYFGAGGIWFQGVNATMIHNTVSGNVASSSGEPGVVGSAIRVVSSAAAPAVLKVQYSIIDNQALGFNVGEYLSGQGNRVTLEHVLWNNVSMKSKFNRIVEYGSKTGPTIFVNAQDNDFHISDRLSAKDAAIGSQTLIDIDGEDRPYQDVADIGADEFRPAMEPPQMLNPIYLPMMTGR